MKIRLDYVTNSSSSSFIIAKHKDCTLDEIKEILSEKQIKAYIKSLVKYYENNADIPDTDYLKSIINKDYDVATEFALNDVAKQLFNKTKYYPLILGDWKVITEEFSNENGTLFEEFIYEHGHELCSEHLKIHSN